MEYRIQNVRSGCLEDPWQSVFLYNLYTISTNPGGNMSVLMFSIFYAK